jgi:hypothetical protein
MKFDKEFLDNYGKIELTPNELKTLDEWHSKFV